MASILVRLSRHSLLLTFLLGAVLSAIVSVVFLEIYGLFFLPSWFEIVTYPGGIVGIFFYNHVVKSVDLAVWVGIVTIAVFYGIIAVGVRRLVGSARKRTMA